MYLTARQPTLETIVVSAGLVAVMAALRGKRLRRVDGCVLGFAFWAAAISVSWRAAAGLGLSQVHFRRMHLEMPEALAALFLCARVFRGRRLWFLKGLALFYATAGVLLAADRVFHADDHRLGSFALTSLTYAVVCGWVSRARGGAAGSPAEISAAGRADGAPSA